MAKYLDLDGLKYVIGKLKDGGLKVKNASIADSASAVAWKNVSGAPTTLSGYGITDAKIDSGTITLGSNSIKPLTSHQDISGKADTASIGKAGGIAPLDANGLIDAKYLPSYVDDIIEGYYSDGEFYSDSAHNTPIAAASAGEGGGKVTGKIYVDITDVSNNKIYRYSGNSYVLISDVPADTLARITDLETAQRDIAKQAGVTSVKVGSNDAESGAVVVTAEKLGLGNVNNTADSEKDVSTATKLKTARTIAISGAVTGTATSFDGSKDITISTTTVDSTKLSTVAIAQGGTGATTKEAAQTALGIVTTDATTSAHGLMSTAYATKLEGIEASATKDSSIPTTEIDEILK